MTQIFRRKMVFDFIQATSKFSGTLLYRDVHTNFQLVEKLKNSATNKFFL